MTIKLCISGASGRMGSTILKVLPEYPDFSLVSALERENFSLLGSPVQMTNTTGTVLTVPAVLFSADVEESIKNSDLVIDFSTASFTERLLSACSKYGKPALIATTGHTQKELAAISEIATRIPILLATNTSLGIFVLNELSLIASKYLGSRFDVEILDLHHKHKKDAPSGTALTLAKKLVEQNTGENIIFSRGGTDSARGDAEVGIQSLRGGDIAGEHTIYFLGSGERIEISHRCTDRAVFARGALHLAQKLVGLPARLYNPSDLFRL